MAGGKRSAVEYAYNPGTLSRGRSNRQSSAQRTRPKGNKAFRERTAEVQDYDYGYTEPLESGARMPFLSGMVPVRDVLASTQDYDFGSRPLPQAPTQRFANGGVVDRLRDSRSPLIGGQSPYSGPSVLGTIREGFREIDARRQAQEDARRQAQEQASGTIQGMQTANRNATSPNSSTSGITGVGAAQAGASRVFSALAQPRTLTNEYGSATVYPGTGDNEAARQGVFDSIDQRAAAGRQAAQGRIARGIQIDPVTGERSSAGGGQGTAFGRFEGIGGMNRQMRQQYEGIQNEMNRLQQMLERGASTSYEPGRPGRGARRGLSVPRMNAIAQRLGQLQNAQTALLGSQVDLAGQDAATERTIAQQMLANQGGRERTAMQGQNTLAGIQARINDPLNQARAQAVQSSLQQQGIEFPPVEIPDIAVMGGQEAQQVLSEVGRLQMGRSIAADRIAGSGMNALQAFQQMQQELAALDDQEMSEEEYMQQAAPLEAALEYLGPQISSGGAFVPRGQGFAAGGLVGAPAGAAGGPVSMPSIQNYQQYVQMARQMGVDPVGLQEFSALSAAPSSPGQPPMPDMQQNAQASQNVIGMADGGMVPSIQEMMHGQVDGKIVMDPDPDAPVDSIPATIDGVQPARLDSGEFVIPADVVMHFGTDKLTKMIEQARNAASGGRTNAPQGTPND